MRHTKNMTPIIKFFVHESNVLMEGVLRCGYTQASERYVKRYIDTSLWSLGFRSKDTSVALQFRIGSSISTSSLPIINATCVALVGDIYRSSTSVILQIVDPQPEPATTTIRPPSHLHASGIYFDFIC